MASSRRTRRRNQQQSFRRHQLRLEGLEQRYAFDAVSVLDSSALPQLYTVIENAGVPVGQVGILVSEMFSADAAGIVITDVNLQGGTLYYSIDDGTTWLDVGPVSESSARSLYRDGTTRLAFSPASDFNGTISGAITAKAWDSTTDFSNGEPEVVTTISLASTYDSRINYGHSFGLTLSPDGSTAYVADWNRFNVVDVHDPSSPAHIATVLLSDSVTNPGSITISNDGNTAYVATKSDLCVIDVSDSVNSTVIGTLSMSWTDQDEPMELTLSPDGSKIYAVTEFGTVHIVDVRESENPVLLGHYGGAVSEYKSYSPALKLSSNGDIAYLACRGGLDIVDVSNPTNPFLISEVYEEFLHGFQLSANGDIAYVLSREKFLAIDISDPINPMFLPNRDTNSPHSFVDWVGHSFHPRDFVITANEKKAYATFQTWNSGVQEGYILEIDLPADGYPRVIGAVTSPDRAAYDTALSPDSNTLFVTGGWTSQNNSGSLQIYYLARGRFLSDSIAANVQVDVPEVISSQGSNILAKDSNQNLYVNTQPVLYQGQQVPQTFFGSSVVGASSNDSENALMLKPLGAGAEDPPTHRLLTDETWRINGIFNSLQNASSPVLDLSGREVSGTLNIAAVAGAYEINGVKNPTLIVRRGQTYTLNLNVAGHPFYLQTTGSGYQSANIYSSGFIGNGQTSGEHQWVVPEDAPDEIFYQCEFHPEMFGKIIVVD